jgi:hypothetical protein
MFKEILRRKKEGRWVTEDEKEESYTGEGGELE